MGDLDYQLLVDALAGSAVNETIQEENPYTGFMNIPGAVTTSAMNLARKDPSSENLRDSTTIGAVSGLLQGLLGTKSRGYMMGKQIDAIESALTDTRSEDMSDALWTTIQTNKLLSGLKQGADIRKREQNLDYDVKLAEEKADLQIRNRILETGLLGETPLERNRAMSLYQKITSAGGRPTEGDIAAPGLSEPTVDEAAPAALPAEGEVASTTVSDRAKQQYNEWADTYGISMAEKMTLSSKLGQDWWQSLDVSTKRSIGQAGGVTSALKDVAKDIRATGVNAAMKIIAKRNPNSPFYKALQRAHLLLVPVVRLGGEVGNVNLKEREEALNAMVGNDFAGSQAIADLIEQAADEYKNISIERAEVAKLAHEEGGTAVLDRMRTPPTPTAVPVVGSAPGGITAEEALAELKRRGIR